MNKEANFSAILSNIQALARQSITTKNLKVAVLRALICVFYVGSGDVCMGPQRTILQATELLSGKHLISQTAVDAVSYRIAHLFTNDQKANSKESNVNSFPALILKRLQQTSLTAPSTAVAVLATCTSYNVMLYLEDVLTQWLGLSRMNREPNASWVLLQEKFQMLDFYSKSNVSIIVSHLLANFLAYSIYSNDAQANEHTFLPVEWNRYAFVYGQHYSLQSTLVSKSNQPLDGSGKNLNSNNHSSFDFTKNWIPCFHRYHNLELDSENDQVTFVPFNCFVSEEKIIVNLLECSIYKKLAAKIATDNGMVFDKEIKQILTKGKCFAIYFCFLFSFIRQTSKNIIYFNY